MSQPRKNKFARHGRDDTTFMSANQSGEVEDYHPRHQANKPSDRIPLKEHDTVHRTNQTGSTSGLHDQMKHTKTSYKRNQADDSSSSIEANSTLE